MGKSPINIEFILHYRKQQKVRVKEKVRKKVAGKWKTSYVYATKEVWRNVTTRQVIPVLPERIEFGRSRAYDDVANIGQRIHTRTGALSVRSFTIDSFFPGQKYGFTQTSYQDPVQLAAWFDQRMMNESKLQVKIPAMKLSFWCNIRDFRYGWEGGTSDLPYVMTVHEERKPVVKTKKIK